MEFTKFGNKYIVRLDKGEEIVETLKEFCNQHEIRLGWIKGIGAVGEATVGLFETAKKEYHSVDLEGDYEITSLLGNISTMNGETYLHLHITLGDDKYKILGGHFSRGVISATGEFLIESIDGEVDREFNDEVGLNLYKFK
ncbi:PPC domain-containing DNA-binding protein [Gudongella sp. DL1XJH-153]|uniref:PPC domain-containing DNA-binding protein n=1 Tax=Gudongella sp. DL1XJH-153 TaxID=3409804 RepID=UPI003BB5E3DC